MWQDAVFFVGNLVFIVALIPTIFALEKPNIWTSFLTGATLLCFALTFTTLGLWFSSFASTVNACLWLILFGQALKK